MDLMIDILKFIVMIALLPMFFYFLCKIIKSIQKKIWWINWEVFIILKNQFSKKIFKIIGSALLGAVDDFEFMNM